MARPKTGLDRKTKFTAIPLRGGMNTVNERGQLQSGEYSHIQNFRQKHPGFKSRKGISKFNTSTSDSKSPWTLYQFSKGERSERHFFAQFSDGLREASADPPSTVTTLNTKVVATSPDLPASYGNMRDIMCYSDGEGQHQLYAGDINLVDTAVKRFVDSAPDNVPTDGVDYTDEMTDWDSTTFLELDSMRDYASSHEALYVKTPIPAKGLYFYIKNKNSNDASLNIYYRKNDNTWAAMGASNDATASGSATLTQSGLLDFTSHPSDEIPWHMFGETGYWYQIRVDATLDSDVQLYGIGYKGDFQDLVNVWDGGLSYLTEARVYSNASDTYSLFSTDYVEVADILGTSDALYFCYSDPLQGVYIDVGNTPNKNGSNASVENMYYWNGSAWSALSNVDDASEGLTNSGWLTFQRPTDEQPTQFKNAQWYAYWYKVVYNSSMDSDCVIGLEGWPYFDLDNHGTKGRVCCAWKNRMAYTWNKFPSYVYISGRYNPTILNGDDYGIVQAGDGRENAVVAMRRFHNELMVWQEEKGTEGGCTTLIQGTGPQSYGKFLISSRIGCMNAKSAVVVDGVMTSTGTEQKAKNLAFWISRYGVAVTDGRVVSIISDPIQNYFDPNDDDCIRRGYENKHWIEFDYEDNVLRMGLVTGSSATEPNKFFVFDLIDKTWAFDDYSSGKEINCMAQVEAASGNVPVLMYGGGCSNGQVYRMNYTASDDGDVIDSYATLELNGDGKILDVREMIIRNKAQSGRLKITPYHNGVSYGSNKILTLETTAEQSSEETRRNRVGLGFRDQHISLKMEGNSTGDELFLYDIALDIYEVPEH